MGMLKIANSTIAEVEGYGRRTEKVLDI